MERFIAHINAKGDIQSCCDHSFNTAEISADNLKSVGLYNTGFLAGLLHDCGKFSDEFTKYIKKAASGEKVEKGKIIHTFAGVRLMLKKYHNSKGGFDLNDISSEIIADAIGNHHGFFDILDENHNNGFEYRLNKQPENDDSSISNFYRFCLDEIKIDDLFNKTVNELAEKYSVIQNLKLAKSETEFHFYLGLLCRLVSSSVMDGDRKDTASFMLGESFTYKSFENRWDQLSQNIEAYIKTFDDKTEINKARKALSDICFDFSKENAGVYKVNIPTGGGKTLATLRLAVEQSKRHNKNRIFYIAPLISILEQNASVIRRAINDDELILEHHSNMIAENETEEETFSKRDFLVETWDASVIITTLVQFLNTCFLGKTSSIRRFHSLCNSVIIIDEVQTVPNNMLSLFNMLVNFLAYVCNSTVILCSATQPNLDKVEHAVKLAEKGADLNEQLSQYRHIFKRNELIYAGTSKLNDIPEYICELTNSYKSILIVCNKKSQSEFLFNNINNVTEHKCFHLSASMCMAHRRKTLGEIYDELKKGNKVICVSTQVIEAGVDISFSAVVRLAAGMDSIVQSAGRCNRNLEFDCSSPVYIINCIDESLKKLQEISNAKDATNALLAEFEKKPYLYEYDLSSEKAIEWYYSFLYRKMNKGYQDFTIKNYKPLENNSLLSLLSSNKSLRDANGTNFFLGQSFKTAGKIFEVFDSNSVSVIVPYEEGETIISEIAAVEPDNYMYLNGLLKKAKSYSVTVYDYQLKKLLESGGVYTLCENIVYVLSKDLYDNNTGIIVSETEDKKECSTLIL